MAPLWFTDASHHNEPLDWDRLAKGIGLNWGGRSAQPLTGAFCKATEGATFVDPQFAVNWAGMHRVRLPVPGAYHFGHPNLSWKTQADFFLRVVAPKPGDHLALDLETMDGQLAPAVAEWGRSWLDYVHRETGAIPWDYTAGYMAAVGATAGQQVYPLWAAEPGVDPAAPHPLAPWRTVALVQYGTDPGGLDRDASPLTLDQIRQYAVGGDMALSADDKKWLTGILLGHETAPDAHGETDPHNLADLLVRFGELVAAGGQNKLFWGWRTGASASWPVAAQLAALSGQVAGLAAAVTHLAAPGGVDVPALLEQVEAAAKAGAEAGLHDFAQAAADATEPTP